jgi:hypothetical protein
MEAYAISVVATLAGATGAFIQSGAWSSTPIAARPLPIVRLLRNVQIATTTFTSL